jgi:hypothetical protein
MAMTVDRSQLDTGGRDLGSQAHGAHSRLTEKWVAATAAGELVGFSAPALAAPLLAHASAGVTLVLFVCAGFVEGAMLGFAQGVVLRRIVPGLRAVTWATATACGAALAWFIAMMPSTFSSGWAQLPPLVVVALAIPAALILLGSLGTAQWLVLRHHVTDCLKWIWVTALAWCLGLGAFMAVATPLWHDGQSAVAIVSIGLVAAFVMAVVVGLVTSAALPRE